MQDIKSPTFYDPLNSVLQDIYVKNLKVNRKETKKILGVAEKHVKMLLEVMKQIDIVFASLFSRLAPTGSFFDKLMIYRPKEFDFNVIMNLPFNYDKIQIEKKDGHPRFVKLNVKNAWKSFVNASVYSTVKSWIDENGYLQEDLVRSWLEGVITRVVHYFSGKYQVRKSGPAFTISIFEDGKIIDIDLVLALEFPSSVKLNITNSEQMNESWLVITKSFENSKRLWQLSFPCSEKNILQNNGNLKLICKLRKALKEKADHIKLASYWIKTLFLWELSLPKHDTGFWNQNSGYLFVLMLEKLKSSLSRKQLPYYWDREQNLYRRFSAEHMYNCEQYINNIIIFMNTKLYQHNVNELKSGMLQLFVKSEL